MKWLGFVTDITSIPYNMYYYDALTTHFSNTPMLNNWYTQKNIYWYKCPKSPISNERDKILLWWKCANNLVRRIQNTYLCFIMYEFSSVACYTIMREKRHSKILTVRTGSMTSSGDTLIEGVLVQPPADSVRISTTSSCLFIPCAVRILKGDAFAVTKETW